ncbi:hypothetical protein [Brunnivagina elsteri]|uniref:Uncharacterized protein n=1 Tax=Brunnivagina elsteri CCALA 953 TaxID=987040 RepID=A0A2A2T9T7_9CYAN|nr:hypothetical protein [Calothrix elsteri]PAX45817.1 hypothetical protein CK510_29680 [Calothrix elsteri CCALA 953]
MKVKSLLIIIVCLITTGIFSTTYNYTENNQLFNISTETNQTVATFDKSDLQISLKLRTPPKRGLPNRRQSGGTRFS